MLTDSLGISLYYLILISVGEHDTHQGFFRQDTCHSGQNPLISSFLNDFFSETGTVIRINIYYSVLDVSVTEGSCIYSKISSLGMSSKHKTSWIILKIIINIFNGSFLSGCFIHEEKIEVFLPSNDGIVSSSESNIDHISGKHEGYSRILFLSRYAYEIDIVLQHHILESLGFRGLLQYDWSQLKKEIPVYHLFFGMNLKIKLSCLNYRKGVILCHDTLKIRITYLGKY